MMKVMTKKTNMWRLLGLILVRYERKNLIFYFQPSGRIVRGTHQSRGYNRTQPPHIGMLNI